MSALATGVRNWRRHFALVPSLYAVKLTLAGLLTLPLLALISDSIAHSRYASPLMREWDLGIVAELLAAHEGIAPSFFVLFFSFLIIAFAVKQFLNGGIYATYTGRSGLTAREFFAESAARFRSHLRISLFMLPVYLGLGFIGFTFGTLLPDTLFGHFGNAAALSRLAPLAIAAIFFLMGILLSESLRLHVAVAPEIHGAARFRPTFDFLRSNGVRLYGCYIVWFAPYFVLWLLVEWLALNIAGSFGNLAGVLLEMLLFQICAFTRTAQSLLFTATAAPLMAAYITSNPTPPATETEPA